MLKKNDEWRLYSLLVKCGYRGSSYINLENTFDDHLVILKYFVYSSPRGSLGCSEGCLVNLRKDATVTVEYKRNGRLYGGDSYGFIDLSYDGYSCYSGIHKDGIADLEV